MSTSRTELTATASGPANALSPWGELILRVHEIARTLAFDQGVPVTSIDTRRDWSDEYDAGDDIVVEVVVRCSQDQRFAYWDALCKEVERLSSGLPDAERCFLDEHVSTAVRTA